MRSWQGLPTELCLGRQNDQDLARLSNLTGGNITKLAAQGGQPLRSRKQSVQSSHLGRTPWYGQAESLTSLGWDQPQ